MKFILVSPKNRTVYNFRGDLIKKIVACGYEVVVTGPNQIDVDKITALGARFVEVPMNKNGVNPFADLKYQKALQTLFEQEKPAGKHGFLTIQGDKMVFEDGTPGRFFGTLFNSGMNFCTHEHAEKTARRLAKFGVNIVRLHQMDADSACPNIFNFTRGAHENSTLTLDPQSLERLDYLQYCLKKEGIYVYVDGINHRIFRSGDGVRNAHLTDQRAGRPFCLFDPTMIELEKIIFDCTGRSGKAKQQCKGNTNNDFLHSLFISNHVSQNERLMFLNSAVHSQYGS